MLKLIKTTVLDASAASVTISNIPQEFKTLKLVMSLRSSNPGGTQDNVNIYPNGSTTNDSSRLLYGTGAGVGSVTYGSNILGDFATGAAITASTFANTEIVFANYSSTTSFKPISISSVTENNGTTAFQNLLAALWSSNSAITSIEIAVGNTFVAGSSFYLYGIA